MASRWATRRASASDARRKVIAFGSGFARPSLTASASTLLAESLSSIWAWSPETWVFSSSICSETRPEPGGEAEAEHVERDDPAEQGAEDRDPAAAAGQADDQAGVGEVADGARASHRRLRKERGAGHRGSDQPARRCLRGSTLGRCTVARRGCAAACGRRAALPAGLAPRRRRGAAGSGACRCRPPSVLLLLADLERGPQVRRAGARVPLELLGPRRDSALGEQLGLGLAPADADRKLRRADAAAGPVGEEALDAPVLERVEGDRAEAPADLQELPGERQRAIERRRARR